MQCVSVQCVSVQCVSVQCVSVQCGGGEGVEECNHSSRVRPIFQPAASREGGGGGF